MYNRRYLKEDTLTVSKTPKLTKGTECIPIRPSPRLPKNSRFLPLKFKEGNVKFQKRDIARRESPNPTLLLACELLEASLPSLNFYFSRVPGFSFEDRTRSYD